MVLVVLLVTIYLIKPRFPAKISISTIYYPVSRFQTTFATQLLDLLHESLFPCVVPYADVTPAGSLVGWSTRREI